MSRAQVNAILRRADAPLSAAAKQASFKARLAADEERRANDLEDHARRVAGRLYQAAFAAAVEAGLSAERPARGGYVPHPSDKARKPLVTSTPTKDDDHPAHKRVVNIKSRATRAKPFERVSRARATYAVSTISR